MQLSLARKLFSLSFKSGGDLGFALTFVNEIKQMHTDLILISSPFTSSDSFLIKLPEGNFLFSSLYW